MRYFYLALHNHNYSYAVGVIRENTVNFYRGTEKQHVADDYAKRLSIGQMECETLVADVAGAYVSGKSGSPPPNFQTCGLLNVSVCSLTEDGNVSKSKCLPTSLIAHPFPPHPQHPILV